MTEHSGNASQEKQHKRWKDYDAHTRDKWLFGILTAACFLILQALLPVDQKDTAFTVSFCAFAVALPLNVLLVLLIYAKKSLQEPVHTCIGVIALAGTFIGVDAAFWHASSVAGVVFSAVSVIAFAVASYFMFF